MQESADFSSRATQKGAEIERRGAYGFESMMAMLAHMSRMSRTAYITKFKRITGEPPARFLRRYRAEAAVRMLAEGGKTLSEIAETVGFFDASHLSKAVKDVTGSAASDVRRKKDAAPIP